MSLPPLNKLEAIDGLLILSGAHIDPQEKASLLSAIAAHSPNDQHSSDYFILQATKDEIWKKWTPDIKGLRKMMTKYLDSPFYDELYACYLKSRQLLKEELKKAVESIYSSM